MYVCECRYNAALRLISYIVFHGFRFDFIALSAEEVAWLTQIISKEDGDIVPLSQVSVDAQGAVRILSEPLKSLENQVLKFDLHKRIAKVQVKFNGKITVLHMGIEIVKR